LQDAKKTPTNADISVDVVNFDDSQRHALPANEGAKP
jgi:hypothetical protein